MYEATLTSAQEYARLGRLEEWIHLFLLGEGNNKAFSDGLKLCERVYQGPVPVCLESLQRDCGPEPGKKWRIPESHAGHFWKKIAEMAERYKEGAWDMPPLIARESGGRIIELNDGNHRYEALRSLGITAYWVILWRSA